MFHRMVVDTPLHEFTGLLHQYTRACEKLHERDVDFTVHPPEVQVTEYEAAYMGSKFRTLFGPAFQANPQAWVAFCDVVSH